jgi:hypothetical protein
VGNAFKREIGLSPQAFRQQPQDPDHSSLTKIRQRLPARIY